ncbi:uncharacterized protein LOC129575120 [Sitodiplosis mosellana]|uniref:uncharacterized protein LOC129575120 n=1 Tax=Sitodiplosis mosellana TaxID=263140 RepID=UPI0024438BBA|nr:uncharacterized protein LOC129575120 [Sitodiplosis mosellana]
MKISVLVLATSIAVAIGFDNGTMINRQPRVGGGSAVGIEKAPYMAYVSAYVEGLESFLCSGVILSEQSVLTSSRCATACQTILGQAIGRQSKSECRVSVGTTGGEKDGSPVTRCVQDEASGLGILFTTISLSEKAKKIEIPDKETADGTGILVSSYFNVGGGIRLNQAEGKVKIGADKKTATVEPKTVYACCETAMASKDHSQLIAFSVTIECKEGTPFVLIYPHRDWINTNFGHRVQDTSMIIGALLLEMVVVAIANITFN